MNDETGEMENVLVAIAVVIAVNSVAARCCCYYCCLFAHMCDLLATLRTYDGWIWFNGEVKLPLKHTPTVQRQGG